MYHKHYISTISLLQDIECLKERAPFLISSFPQRYHMRLWYPSQSSDGHGLSDSYLQANQLQLANNKAASWGSINKIYLLNDALHLVSVSRGLFLLLLLYFLLCSILFWLTPDGAE